MNKGVSNSISNSMSKSMINRTKIKQQIIKALRESDKPLSTSEIARIMDRNWHTIVRYCLDLEIERKISKFSMGRISAWQVKK